ncbi:hypothetical protein Chor_014809, partial [Crotalus horridus]
EGNPSGVYALRGSSPRLGVLTSVTTTMPVQPLPKEMEGEGDSATEMNGEEESEDERSASQSESEEESSEMNDEDYERRRAECVDEMLDLEKQFSEIKEKLFKERLNQVKAKLEDVMSGKAAEYLNPLAVLQNHMQIQIEVAGKALWPTSRGYIEVCAWKSSSTDMGVNCKELNNIWRVVGRQTSAQTQLQRVGLPLAQQEEETAVGIWPVHRLHAARY